MPYFTIDPPPYLKEFVRFYWVLESDMPYYTHRSMADVCPELLFHYKGQFVELKPGGGKETSYTAGIHGQTNRVSWFQIESSFGIFGVYFYPYALKALFNIPSIEVTNQQIALYDLLGYEGKDLEEKMLSAKNNEERVGIINSHFRKNLIRYRIKTDPLQKAVHHVIRSKGTTKIRDLAHAFCLSERQFERNFKKMSGLSPKSFSKIVRFHAAFADYDNSPTKTLTEIAYEYGYYDQSHFVQDSKAFSGISPSELFSGKAEGLDWMKG